MKHFILLLLLFSLIACDSETSSRGPDNSQVSSAVLKNYTGKRIALVIGNWKYKFKPLHNPENDARDMAQVLRNLGFEVIHKQNLSLDDMEDEIIQFKVKLQNKGQVGLFYYAGHGLEIQGKNYLLATDLRKPETELIKDKSIPAQLVINIMKGSGSLVNIMILDACRTFPRLDRNSINNADYGLAAMNAPSGSIISFATGSGQSTPDGEKGSNGLYTGHLLKFLQQPGLKIEEVFKKTRQQVALETNNEQVPPVYNSMVGDFCLVSCEKAKSDDKEKILQAKLEKERQEKAALQAQLEALKKKPGTVFRDRLADGSFGPEMVWIPSGSFRMGDIQGGGDSDEKPVHRVSVEKFAMGKFEVTFAEYDKFAEADGREKPNDSGWGRGNRPVINVSWNDAEAYAKWLSDQTGKKYRLPTEAEWEYAARAGTETKYWWGNDIGKNRANCDGCGSQWDDKSTAPVGSFEANKFGLYDTSGNVWEWTCSEYEDKYKGKEKVCINKNSNKNWVLRGGSWYSVPRDLRAARRVGDVPDRRNDLCGFRLVRAAWT
jgi:formylglycine-generating enzyme required for sulfatase activity